MKECRKCNVELVSGENINPNRIKNRDYICKPCSNVYNNKQYHTKDIIKLAVKKYDRKNKQILAKKRDEWSRSKQGVYGIFSGETCLYVGESSRLLHRISHHKGNIKKPKGIQKELYIRISRHDNVYFKVLEETKNHKEQEKVWIEYMNPLYNTYNEKG